MPTASAQSRGLTLGNGMRLAPPDDDGAIERIALDPESDALKVAVGRPKFIQLPLNPEFQLPGRKAAPEDAVDQFDDLDDHPLDQAAWRLDLAGHGHPAPTALLRRCIDGDPYLLSAVG